MKSSRLSKVMTYLALGTGSVLMIFPFIWMILTAFKTNSEVMRVPTTILPEHWGFGTFEAVLDSLPFANMYLNTGLMILFRVICAVIFSSMAGYAFAKLEFKFKNILFTPVIVQMMLPGQIFIIPQYQMLAAVGLTDSLSSQCSWLSCIRSSKSSDRKNNQYRNKKYCSNGRQLWL